MSSQLLGFMLAMLLYPDVQAKARRELDRVAGDRLPTTQDMQSTPYLNAILTESLRFHHMDPLGAHNGPFSGHPAYAIRVGAPHRLMQDDVYNGYSIPAGTVVIYNVW